jgi:hypothetical protein
MKSIRTVLLPAILGALPLLALGAQDRPAAAQPTASQRQELAKLLDGPSIPAPVRPIFQQSRESMTEVLLYLSCYPGWDAWKYLGDYQVPGTGNAYYLAAMNATHYHDRSQCLTIRRISSVQQASADTLSFRVLFVADDSNESADRTFGMVRQPDGRWLFARGGF